MKSIRYDLRDQHIMRQMLLIENEVSNQVRSPHLLPVLATEMTQEVCRIFSPLLVGYTLAQLLEQRGQILIPQAIWYMRQTVTALGALHKAGWVHGDVTPSNIHVSATGHVTLIDLGFARKLDSQPSQQEDFRKGTLRYVAPELLCSSYAANEQSDFYGVGATLFELVTGQRLFPQGSQNEVIDAQLHAARPNLQDYLPNASAELQTLFISLLAKQPLRRPHSAEELERQLLELEVMSLSSYSQAG